MHQRRPFGLKMSHTARTLKLASAEAGQAKRWACITGFGAEYIGAALLDHGVVPEHIAVVNTVVVGMERAMQGDKVGR